MTTPELDSRPVGRVNSRISRGKQHPTLGWARIIRFIDGRQRDLILIR